MCVHQPALHVSNLAGNMSDTTTSKSISNLWCQGKLTAANLLNGQKSTFITNKTQSTLKSLTGSHTTGKEGQGFVKDDLKCTNLCTAPWLFVYPLKGSKAVNAICPHVSHDTSHYKSAIATHASMLRQSYIPHMLAYGQLSIKERRACSGHVPLCQYAGMVSLR